MLLDPERFYCFCILFILLHFIIVIMPRRKRKIEVSADTQSFEFQLGDSSRCGEKEGGERAEEAERETGEGAGREGREGGERDWTERGRRERDWTERRVRRTQRQTLKLLLHIPERHTLARYSYEEALVEFIKNHPELYDKGHEQFKNCGRGLLTKENSSPKMPGSSSRHREPDMGSSHPRSQGQG